MSVQNAAKSSFFDIAYGKSTGESSAKSQIDSIPISDEMSLGGGSEEYSDSISVSDEVQPSVDLNSVSQEDVEGNTVDSPALKEPETLTASSDVNTTTPASTETIEILDGKGGRKSVEINYADREAVKKTYQDRYNFEKGMRKMQLERDQLLKTQETDKGELKKFEYMNKVYEEQGIEGLIDLIEGQGRTGYHKDWVGKKRQEEDWLRQASPEQLRAKELQDRLTKLERDTAKKDKEAAERLEKADKEREEAKQQQIDSMFLPSIDKYGFSGKFGNAESEEIYNEMLFERVKRNLSTLAEDSAVEVQLTPAMVEGEFKRVAQLLNKQIGQQVETKTSKVIEQKKQEAMESVQQQVKSTYKTDSAAKKNMELLKQGKLAQLFSRLS